MASLKYIAKGTGNLTTIYLRFRQGRKIDITKSTNLLINPKYWNNKKGAVKHIAENKEKINLQNDLNSLGNHILNNFNKSYSKGAEINSQWLKKAMDAYFERSDDGNLNLLLDYAEYYKESLPNKVMFSGKVGVSNGTLKKYGTIINKIKDFESFNKKRYKLVDVDLNFHRDFINYFRKQQRLSFNTIGKNLKFIKTIVNDAKNSGYKVSIDIEKREFRPTKEETYFSTLSETEIQRIFDYDFGKSPYLDNARNWLVIGVWTGARVSDLLKFSIENIKNDLIEYTSQKTDQKILLPLHPQVKAILENLNGQFPKRISDQKFNMYIKIVCKEVGLTETIQGAKKMKIDNFYRKKFGEYPKFELVTSHICRRSFATNHYGKLPTPVIMAITGHKTEKMFLSYIGKTAMDSAEVLHKYWELQENKKNKKTTLNVLKDVTNE